MILIKDNQRKFKIDKKNLHELVQKILDILEYSNFDISIWLTTNKTIQKYNNIYRKKDKPTDILSFPYHDQLKPGQRIKVNDEDDKNLGDIIISLEFVKKDLKNWNQTFEQRMKILLVHGICHLLGYDHIDDKDYEIMNRLEKKILNTL